MLIKVTQEDIDNGIRGKCYFCPVAQAINRVLQKVAAVRSDVIEIFNHEETKYEKPTFTSKGLQARIDTYDDQFGMSPFEFEFELGSFAYLPGEVVDYRSNCRRY